jgi:hypothetical protein
MFAQPLRKAFGDIDHTGKELLADGIALPEKRRAQVLHQGGEKVMCLFHR